MSSNGGMAPLFTQIDPKSMSISPPIKSKRAGPASYNMYINGPSRTKLEFQLTRDEDPKRTPQEPAKHRNVIIFVNPPQNGGSKIKLTLSINPHDAEFVQFWKQMDDLVIEHVALHSKEFLKTKMTADEVRAIFTPTLRIEEGKDPFIKIRMDTAPDAKVPTLVWDINEVTKKYARFDPSRLDATNATLSVVRPGMVYIYSGRVGYTIDATHVIRYAPPQKNNFPFQLNCKFTECEAAELWEEEEAPAAVEGEEEEEEEEKEPPPSPRDSPTTVQNRKRKAMEFPSPDPEEEEEQVEIVEAQKEDGSTVTIDPITLMPVAPEKKSKRTRR